ncbi:hypothetical protein ACFL01_04475, partial [Planctomycetota bacterium]
MRTTLIFVCVSLLASEACGADFFHIEKKKIGLLWSYESENERRSHANTESKHSSQSFHERLELEARGWIYHPALIEYTVGFEPEWEQRTERSDGTEERNDSFTPGYSLSATLLGRKPVAIDLFARRHETVTENAYAKKSESEVETHGGSLMLKNRLLPTTLSYTHIDSDQTGFYVSNEERDDFRASVRHVGEDNSMRLNASYVDKVKTTAGITTATRSSSNSLYSDYDFSKNKSRILSSILSYRWTDSGFAEATTLSVAENFKWQHARNFRS